MFNGLKNKMSVKMVRFCKVCLLLYYCWNTTGVVFSVGCTKSHVGLTILSPNTAVFKWFKSHFSGHHSGTTTNFLANKIRWLGLKKPLSWLTLGIKNISHAHFHHALYQKRATMVNSSPLMAGIPMAAFNEADITLVTNSSFASAQPQIHCNFFLSPFFLHTTTTLIDGWIWYVRLHLPSSLPRPPLIKYTFHQPWPLPLPKQYQLHHRDFSFAMMQPLMATNTHASSQAEVFPSITKNLW